VPVYNFRAKNWNGVWKEGVVTADEKREAARSLGERGLVVISIKDYRGLHKLGKIKVPRSLSREAFVNLGKTVKFSSILKTRPGTRDLMFFSRQFSTMIDAGITILNGLQLLKEQMEHPVLKKKLGDVAKSVEEGNSLAESFRAQNGIFPSLFINMIEAGESSGALETVLKRMALHFEKQHDLEQKIKSATIYPKFIITVIFLAVIFLMTVVLPRITGMFEGMNVKLPATTRMLLVMGEVLSSYWHLVLLALLLIYFGLNRFLTTEKGVYYRDRLRLSLPLSGSIYRKILIARFSRTLGMLLASGVGLLQALELVEKVTGNMVFEDIIKQAREGIAEGQPMAEPLAAAAFFPSMVIEMISIGEQTGTLDGMLIKAAEFFEADVSYVVERLSSLTEPVLILFMAGIIGFIAVSILMPMLEVYQLF
jgi:type IV pilus assembly protein PilC